MTDLTAISALLASYPGLAHADLSPVRTWINEGADLNLDILPVLKHWIARKADIYSLGFFVKYVQLARDARLIVPRPVSIHDRARSIAFLTRKLGQRYPTDERWLERYETEHGSVKL